MVAWELGSNGDWPWWSWSLAPKKRMAKNMAIEPSSRRKDMAILAVEPSSNKLEWPHWPWSQALNWLQSSA